MKTLRNILLPFVSIVVSLNFCQGQNNIYMYRLRPKAKEKIESLYPEATYGRIESNDTSQSIDINCHCDETKGMIILTFDTNGNLLNKEVHYGSLQGLPDTILNYIQKKKGPNVEFLDEMRKIINNKGEVYYEIIVNESNDWSVRSYILKFTPSGELISKELLPTYGR